MTRRLGLLRHAKSAYPVGIIDHERPLSTRGRRDAPVAGHVLRERLGDPDLVLVSSARRTQETWNLARLALVENVVEQTSERVYDASPGDVLDVIRSVPDAVKTLVVVGHVPGVSDLAILLAGSGDQAALAAMRQKFPTSGLACLDVVVPWQQLESSGGRLTSFDVPRGIKE